MHNSMQEGDSTFSGPQALNQPQHFEGLLNDILEMTLKVFKADAGLIRILEKDNRELVLKAHKGIALEKFNKKELRRRYGEGKSWECVQLGRPIITEKSSMNPIYLNKPLEMVISLTVPLKSNNQLIGSIALFSHARNHFNKEDIELFSYIGNQIGVALDNARLLTQVEKRTKALTALNEVSQTVNQTLNLEQVLNDTLDKVMEQLNLHSALIRLLDNQTQELVLAAQKGLSQEDLEKIVIRRKLEESTLRLDLDQNTVLIIEDILTDPRYANREGFAKKIGCRSLVSIPLVTKDKLLGNMSFRTREPRVYATEEVQLFTSIGHQIGMAIENARLYQDKEVTIKKLNETQERLQQSQKMEAIGTLTGGIAHDFNNILGIILGNAELAMIDVPEFNPARRNLEEIRTASFRAKDVVQQLLAFSRKTDLERKPVRLEPIIKESLKLLRASIPTSIKIVQNFLYDSNPVLADATQINQVMINICTNSAHAMPDGGILAVSIMNKEIDEDASYPDLTPGRYVELTVSDSGHGIDADIQDRIFDPYFTTKEVGKGTGMGLSVVHGIITKHGGAISVSSEPGKGTTFQILFPAIETEEAVEVKIDEALPRGNETILLVDDEEQIVNMERQMLENLGYHVTYRIGSTDALAVFQSEPDKFDLIITDMTMPNMSGIQLSHKIQEIKSDIPIIICTGFSEQISEEKAKALGISGYIMKPVSLGEFAKKIREVLGQS